jgi:hypothetical protein
MADTAPAPATRRIGAGLALDEIKLIQFIVIASEAKQSSAAAPSGLLRRFAPRNDDQLNQLEMPRQV